ncbi:MAG: VPLPA-CTERM sorting domain-containing protein [Gammaproteobacteria bacterium]
MYSDNTINGTTGFQAVIMQAYNFYGDPSLGAVHPVDYTAHWSNTAPVPVPPALWLLASSIIGVVGIARRRASPA